MVPGSVPPFHQLDEYKFQSLCCDLFDKEPQVANCEVYGKRGQKQYGIDLLAIRKEDNGIEVGQCKCYERYTPSNVKAASEEFLEHWDGHWRTRDVRQFVLFVACDIQNTRTLDAIDEQRKRFRGLGVQYCCWSARTIKNKLLPHRSLAANHLPDYWVADICGQPEVVGTALQPASGAANVISGALYAQLENLSEILSKEVRDGLERARERSREGYSQEAQIWISALRSDRHRWDALIPKVRAEVLRFEARLALDVDRDTSRASQLSDLAADLTPDQDHRLRALIAAHTQGPEAGLEALADSDEQETLHLRAAIYIEQRAPLAALDVLSRIDVEQVNAETNRLRALSHLMTLDLDSAQIAIQDALGKAPKSWAIQFAAGAIDYYRGLAGSRLVALDWPRPVDWAVVRQDDASQKAFKRAASFFQSLVDIEAVPTRRRLLETWQLAATANLVASQDSARKLCQVFLETDPTNQTVLAWANARTLIDDLSLAEAALVKLVAKKTASTEQVLALVALQAKSGSYDEAMSLITDHAETVEDIDDVKLLSYWKAQILIAKQQPNEALSVLDGMDSEADVRPLRAAAMEILARTSDDWSPLTEFVESWYEDTADPLVLLRLCEVYGSQGDWRSLSDKDTDLLRDIPTPDGLAMVVESAFRLTDYNRAVTLLDQHRSVFPGGALPGHLRRARIRCLKELGILPEALTEARELVVDEKSLANMFSLVDIYMASGDFKQLAATARQLANNPEVTPSQALQLASLVSSEDRELAIRFWHMAGADKMPDDLVTQAVTVAYRLGLDKEIQGLQDRFNTLAGRSNTGIRAFTLPEVKDYLTKERVEREKNEEEYRKAKLPLHLLADRHGLNLVEVYHGMLEENEMAPAPMKQSALLIRHGGRQLEDLATTVEWKLHLDISALLLAAHWDILEEIERLFAPIFLPQGIMPLLLIMRDRLMPHQPARLATYQKIIEKTADGGLLAAQPAPVESGDASRLVEQLGKNWVGLYDAALQDRGYLLDFLPPTSVDPPRPPEVLPVEFASTVVNLRAVLEALSACGAVNPLDYPKHLSDLGVYGQEAPTDAIPRKDSSLYCRANTIEVLVDAELLPAVCRTFKVTIEQMEYDTITASIRGHDRARRHLQWLETVIARVRDGLTLNRYRFIARRDAPLIENDSMVSPAVDVLLSLLALDSEPGSVLWIDDRALNRYAVGGTMPIVGINDVAKALYTRGVLKPNPYFDFLSHQRAANVRFIPLEQSEIRFALMEASIDAGRVRETPRLRALRQSIAAACLASDDIERPPLPVDSPNPHGEIAFIVGLASAATGAIVQVWIESSDRDTAAARAEWILSNLYFDHLAFRYAASLPELSRQNVFTVGISLAGLVSQAVQLVKDRERRRQYLNWLYERVLAPRFHATPRLRDAVANNVWSLWSEVREGGEDSAYEPALINRVFQQIFEDLPKELQTAIGDNAGSLDAIGIDLISTVEFEDLSVRRSEFFNAVERAERDGAATVRTVSPPGEIVLRRDSDPERLSFNFEHPTTGVPYTFHNDVLGLVLSSGARVEFLERHKEWFDCSTDERVREVNRIAALASPESRIDAASEWLANSPSLHYAKVEKLIHKGQDIKTRDMMPPLPERLLKHLRLPVPAGDIEKFRDTLNAAATALCDEEGPVEAFRRLGGLPVNLPSSLLDHISELPQAERRDVVRELILLPGSPVSRIQLLRLLRNLGSVDSRYVRLGRRLVRRITSADDQEEFRTLRAILDFTDHGVDVWARHSDVSTAERILITWYHAHCLMTLLSKLGVPAEPMRKGFDKAGRNVTVETFRREPEVNYDALNPRAAEHLRFLLGGLEYAVGDEAAAFGEPEMWTDFAGQFFVETGDTRLPCLAMLLNNALGTDCLGSFVSGDRALKLRRLVPKYDTGGLAYEDLDGLATDTAKQLQVGGDSSHWLLLYGILDGCPANERVAAVVQSLVLATDYVKLFQTDQAIGRVALHVSVSQAVHLGATEVCEHLQTEIQRVATYLARELDLDDSNAETAMSLFDACAGLARAKGGDSQKVVEEFSTLSVGLIDAFPALATLSRDTVLRFYDDLPIPHAQKLARLLTRIRAE